jgi:hypothetical protein
MIDDCRLPIGSADEGFFKSAIDNSKSAIVKYWKLMIDDCRLAGLTRSLQIRDQQS